MHYNYELRTETLERTSTEVLRDTPRTDFDGIKDRFKHLLKGSPLVEKLIEVDKPLPTPSGSADRSTFYPSMDDFRQQLDKQPVQFVREGEDHDDVFVLPPHIEADDSIYERPCETNKLLNSIDDSRTQYHLEKRIKFNRDFITAKANETAWWWMFRRDDHYTHNPYQQDPTEQLRLHFPGNKEVMVHNFGELFSEKHIHQTVRAASFSSMATNTHSLDIVPNIVFHNAFKARQFKRSNRSSKAAGQAWRGQAWVEVNSDSFTRDRVTRSRFLEQTIVHEIHHQIDDDVDHRDGVFTDYFMYIDDDKDGVIDRTFPEEERKRWAYLHGNSQTNGSKPHRDYGLTNPLEDFAVTSERAAFGEMVDPYRRNAYLSVLLRCIAKREGIDLESAGIAHTLNQESGTVGVEVLRGSDIVLPQTTQAVRPIRLVVKNTSGTIDSSIARLEQTLSDIKSRRLRMENHSSDQYTGTILIAA